MDEVSVSEVKPSMSIRFLRCWVMTKEGEKHLFYTRPDLLTSPLGSAGVMQEMSTHATLLCQKQPWSRA